MKKVYHERPEFDGLIAYNDPSNRQVSLLLCNLKKNFNWKIES